MREWILIVAFAAFAAFAGAVLGGVVWTKWPTCRPGQGGGIVIGGTMLMGGCK
jgi:hypothetical protein